MKLKTSFIIVLIVLFALPSYPALSQIIQEPNLEIIKVVGVSDAVGTFGYIESTFLKQRNFYKQGMAFDSKGNLYIGDSADSQIEVFDENLKPLRHFGGIGTGDGQFQYLVDLKIDQDQLFVLDLFLGRIQVFDLQGQLLYQFRTSLEEDSARSYPTGMAISRDHIFVIDLLNGLKLFSKKGEFIRTVEGAITDTLLEKGIDYFLSGGPVLFEDIQSDESGNIYVLLNYVIEDYFVGGQAFVLVMGPNGESLSPDPEKSYFDLSSNETPNACFALEGDYLYCAAWNPGKFDPYDSLIEKCFRYRYSLNPVGFGGSEREPIFWHEDTVDTGVEIQSPTGMLVRSEVLYILDSDSNKIFKVSLKGEILGTYESPKRPFGLLSGIIGDRNELLVADRGNGEIAKLNANLEVTGKLGRPGDSDLLPNLGEFVHPNSFVRDAKGYLYCSDRWYGCIQVFDPSLKPFYRIYPLNRLYHATGMVIDSQGVLWLYDSYQGAMYALDISLIQDKSVNVLSTFSTKDIWFETFAMSQKGNFLVPQSGDKILTEVDKQGHPKGHIKNPAPIADQEEFILPRAICQDDAKNYLLVDEWGGKTWKLDPTLKSTWTMDLGWFGIGALWTGEDGLLYGVDQAHSVIVVLKDHTFVEKPPATLSILPYPTTTYQEQLLIKGKTDPGNQLKISGSEILPDQDGNFEWELNLAIGENLWTLVASNSARKTTSKEIKITRKQTMIIQMKLGSKLVKVNEKEQMLEAPIYRDNQANRIYAPARILVEAIDGTIEWVPKEQKITVQLTGIELILHVGDPFATINGKKIPIDPINKENKSVKVVPQIVKGRLFLPLRFVSEQLGYKVEWIAKTEEIILTYPDPTKATQLHKTRFEEFDSIGKILGISMADTHCTVFPAENNESVVFIGTEVPYGDNDVATGFVRLDAKGEVNKSHVINTGFDQVLKLANQQYLLIQKRATRSEFDKVTIKGLHLTWLGKEGEILKSKVLTFTYSDFFISSIYSACELSNQDLQIVMIVYSFEVADLSGEQMILVLNPDGTFKQSTVLPENKFLIGPESIACVYGYNEDDPEASQDQKVSLFDLEGKTLWTKKIILPKPDTAQKSVDSKLVWLSDGTLLLSSIVRGTKCYLTRIDKDGKVLWGTKLTLPSNQWFYYPNMPVLLPGGDLLVSYCVMSEDSPVVLMPVAVLDKEGGLRTTIDLNPSCYENIVELASGDGEDFWICGKTYEYAFGLSSLSLYHVTSLADIPGCYEPTSEIKQTDSSVELESLQNENDITLTSLTLKTALQPRDTKLKPSPAITKDLCLDRIK